jgi:hypothetical protein
MEPDTSIRQNITAWLVGTGRFCAGCSADRWSRETECVFPPLQPREFGAQPHAGHLVAGTRRLGDAVLELGDALARRPPRAIRLAFAACRVRNTDSLAGTPSVEKPARSYL